jgi:hypothetical protein
LSLKIKWIVQNYVTKNISIIQNTLNPPLFSSPFDNPNSLIFRGSEKKARFLKSPSSFPLRCHVGGEFKGDFNLLCYSKIKQKVYRKT